MESNLQPSNFWSDALPVVLKSFTSFECPARYISKRFMNFKTVSASTHMRRCYCM